jgi:hypothetical protein
VNRRRRQPPSPLRHAQGYGAPSKKESWLNMILGLNYLFLLLTFVLGCNILTARHTPKTKIAAGFAPGITFGAMTAPPHRGEEYQTL